MANPGMKPPGGSLVTGLVVLVLLAAVAPLLIELSRALLPLILVGGVVAVGLRLTFFHTRRW